MVYVLSIDWLSIFCIFAGDGDTWNPVESPKFSYKQEDFGTRCFSRYAVGRPVRLAALA